MAKTTFETEEMKELAGFVIDGLKPLIEGLRDKSDILQKLQTLTVEEVAKALCVDKGTVLRHIDKGLIKATRPGKHWIITQESYNNYINGNK